MEVYTRVFALEGVSLDIGNYCTFRAFPTCPLLPHRRDAEPKRPQPLESKQMAVLEISAVIALSGYAYGFIKARELSALRKEMKLYMDRMEAAELDLHAIRSVAEHRLHGAGKQFADLYSRLDGATVTLTTEDQMLLAMMPFHIQDVEDIVNERGPKTINGRPFWEVEPSPHDYEYGPQYPLIPGQR